MGELAKCKNIGKAVEYQLNQAGISTVAQLKEIGAEHAWLKIQNFDSSACASRLYALEGAILDLRKADLPFERKAELKQFYDEHKL